MTTVVEDSTDAGEHRGEAPAHPPASHRLLGRLSTGHLLMLLAGAVAAVANYAVLAGSADRAAVVVADATIVPGDPLDPDALATVEAPASGPLADRVVAAADRSAVEGAVATARIEPGEPLRHSDVQQPAASEGRRAMSLPVAAEHAVGGALEPGDRVDVIETADGDAAYLVTGAPVLEPPDTGGLEGLSDFSVTIAVDADEALRLAEAVHEQELDVVRATGAAPADAAGASEPTDTGAAP
jgi:pilus assembly protein CpaB